MAHSGISLNVYSCLVDGCSNDLVCIEVHIRNRREPLYVGHRQFCTTHAVSQGIRILGDHVCDAREHEAKMDEAYDMERTVSDDINSSYQ